MLWKFQRKKEVQNRARLLVDTYGDLSFRLAYTYLGSIHDAEDVSQEILIKLISRDIPFESDAHEKAWVIRCTSNACKDILRSAARRKTISFEALEPTKELVSSPLADSERDELVGKTLQNVMTLAPQQREAIFLYYYENMSIHEISALVGASEDAVAQRLSRARKQLKLKLEEANDDRVQRQLPKRVRQTLPFRYSETSDHSGGNCGHSSS